VKICVHGLWHLGSVTAACLASLGHMVVGLDRDREVIKKLTLGHAPLYEPGLDELLQKGIDGGNLFFTSDAYRSVKDAQILWVTFDTPVNDEDVADVQYVSEQIKGVLSKLADGAIVLISSQMPVGSVRALEEFADQHYKAKGLQFACSPENLRLGKACDIFLNPDRIVVGTRTPNIRTRKVLEELLFPISKQIEWMSIESAEMTKHAINAFLATSVTFANEMAVICELVGADAKEVERGLKTEMRIGPGAYLSPGGPFAGGTLARDIEYLGSISNSSSLATPLLSSVRKSNDEHKNWVRRKLLTQFTNLKGVRIAIWGLTYKPGTDTLRRSLAIELCEWLIEQGSFLTIFDPVVQTLPLGWAGVVSQSKTALDAVVNADALVVGTEWSELRSAAEKLILVAKKNMVVIDPNRHLFTQLGSSGLRYLAVGAPMHGKGL
jgi:UDPglucose 6-dehydrogenase